MAKPWKTSATVVNRNGDPVTVNLIVEIDWEEIAYTLARQASRNKSRKATLINKAIRARIAS